jgi:hypothetical protein
MTKAKILPDRNRIFSEGREYIEGEKGNIMRKKRK